MKLLKNVRDSAIRWLAGGYLKRKEEELQAQFDIAYATVSVKDLVRERLKGIKPNNPEEDTKLNNYLASLDDNDRLAFLSKAYDMVRNKTLSIVIESLIVESEHKAMMYAEDMAEVNFNRATINGLTLLEEKILYLAGMFKEEQERAVKMSPEEKFSPL